MEIVTQKIQDKILIKSIRTDKNGRDYLILELEQGESIFVFDNQATPAESWDYLEESNEYLFTVKEGQRIGTNVLVEFKKANLTT